MARIQAGTLIDLAPREAITLNDVRGSTLRITRGTLWLTQENDPSDVILRGGDNWVVERQGATVLEAQDHTVLWVVGRDVDGVPAAANQPSFDDWRAHLTRLFPLTPRQPLPYY